jgi:hypothetical protein
VACGRVFDLGHPFVGLDAGRDRDHHALGYVLARKGTMSSALVGIFKK